MTTADAFDPALLRSLRAAPWRTIEKRFLFILSASIAAHIAFATFIAAQPAPTYEAFEEPAERTFRPQVLPPLHKIPNIPDLPVKAPARPTAAPSPAAPKPAGAPRAVAQAAVERVFGNGVATMEILGAPTTAFTQAMENVQGPSTYFGNVGPAKRGPATGEVQTVAPIGTEGVKQVTIGTRSDKAPATTTTGPIELEPTDDLDPRVLQQFITARRAAVQGCFERALLHNGGLAGGKVAMRLVIGAGGRVTSVGVEEDTLKSDAVNTCMTTLMRRWIFPVSPKDEVPLSVPFIFARAP